MNCSYCHLDGVITIHPQVFGDERGFFLESYNEEKFRLAGIFDVFRQDNHSRSVKNTLRGLHFQTKPGQAKLVRAVSGVIWDVAVDLRKNSKTFGSWFSIELSAENKKILYVPVGFAHGFCVISDYAEVVYKASNIYNPETESGIMWNDPHFSIPWPVKDPILSARDYNNCSFADYKKNPVFFG
ncbi:MAG: dTDP-4-dehydrorhamnose 3,5-epimerase [Spirochaetes bacterium GWF1_41_5]|nr:MAG: dTDP-4-dehydrorhamnose 3,5-epimerase [Spirochaetes bacterium GWF1_41_5]HBE01104.1 dTDP-4-dehydrorhamnose 3,5-epimerase [Spirochaetia bacterium]